MREIVDDEASDVELSQDDSFGLDLVDPADQSPKDIASSLGSLLKKRMTDSMKSFSAPKPIRLQGNEAFYTNKAVDDGCVFVILKEAKNG